MALAIARTGEDRAQKRDVVAARDPFKLLPVQLASAFPGEHPSIVFARHKFLLFYRVRTEAPVPAPIHAKPAWLWEPRCLRPALPQFALPWFQKKRL